MAEQTMNGANPAKEETENRFLDKFGLMRRRYLKEHRPLLWNELILTGKLYSHLYEIQDAADSRMEQLMPELAKAAGATEELKRKDQLRWVGLMNCCRAQAEEIILNELVYV